MQTRYVLLILAYLLSVAGGAIGASFDSKAMMLLGTLPGLLGIIGLLLIYGRDA
jgi:hypothetical protein